MHLDQFVELAVQEDVGEGDHTSLACIPEKAEEEAKLLVKDEGIIAGIHIAQSIAHRIDPSLQFQVHINDGAKVESGNVAFIVCGKARSLLKAERLVLNVMQRMSGIATRTKQVVQQLEGLKTKVLDTRKTTPLLRFLEKEAVQIGGGVNHRMGLYDMIMIKDNHIDYAGGIEAALHSTRNYLLANKLQLKIEIEARDLSEVEQILNVGGADRIMLDNFSFEDLRKAVAIIEDRAETEASGGITLETARAFAECGVDYISMGELTHTVRNFDLSLKAI